MTACAYQAAGEIELYFYDELEPGARAAVDRHLRSCAECRGALEELSMIRSALLTTPPVEAPPDGHWTAFMRRLGEAIEADGWPSPRVVGSRPIEGVDRRRTYAPYLAMAALLTLVTAGVAYVARSAPRPSTSAPADTHAAAVDASLPDAGPALVGLSEGAAFAALSEQHFERSKLVVLGLANKDAHGVREADWAYERGMATSLLSDTRLYRLAAEDRGLKTLAGVMGDLEIVLLQTSLAEALDADALGQIQRLIHKRDLVTKMDVTAAGSSGS